MGIRVQAVTIEKELQEVEWPTLLEERPLCGEFLMSLDGKYCRRITAIRHAVIEKPSQHVMILELNAPVPTPAEYRKQRT